MHERTFAELYCEQHGLPESDFVQSVWRETLYPHARIIASLIQVLKPRHFAADLEFAHDVGRIRRFRDYATEAEAFAHHPENRGLLRTIFNIRVSARRMRRLVRTTLHATVPAGAASAEGDPHSVAPFAASASRRVVLRPGDAGKL
ncbi:MAG: hypothetical protein MUE42_08540 [Opitutaceae bacterium]|nr:hypothetical protein [Opitutaceae bacterium]